MRLHRLRLQEVSFAYRANRIADHVLATINREHLMAIRDEEVIQPGRRLIDFKYFNVRPWIIENIQRALRLGLDRERGKYILDIGTGFGYFPYVCEFMEHHARALDVDGHRLYDQVIAALAIDRWHHWVKPLAPLPASDRRFDYVTAYQVAFNRPGKRQEWGADEWEYFITDLLDNQLAPGGRLHLELNWSISTKGWYDRRVARVFSRHGATRQGNEVDIVKT